MDIRFYTLDFSDLRILPGNSQEIGYTSVKAEVEFRGSGSIQIVFQDEELEEFARLHPEGLLAVWGKFWGYITDYQFKEKEHWLCGSSLNALLHKFTIPQQSLTDADVKQTVKGLIDGNTPFSFYDNGKVFEKATFATSEGRQYLDEFLIALTEQQGIGYRVFVKDKRLWLELLSSDTNPLMLSKNNLNVQNPVETFSNKTAAYSGWYQKEQENDGTKLPEPVWTHIKGENKEGLYQQEVILKATMPGEAESELGEYKSTREIELGTRNLVFQEDYQLGDIVRYQEKTVTQKKQITRVSMWYEGMAYHEEPTLTEWEE